MTPQRREEYRQLVEWTTLVLIVAFSLCGLIQIMHTRNMILRDAASYLINK